MPLVLRFFLSFPRGTVTSFWRRRQQEPLKIMQESFKKTIQTSQESSTSLPKSPENFLKFIKHPIDSKAFHPETSWFPKSPKVYLADVHPRRRAVGLAEGAAHAAGQAIRSSARPASDRVTLR